MSFSSSLFFSDVYLRWIWRWIISPSPIRFSFDLNFPFFIYCNSLISGRAHPSFLLVQNASFFESCRRKNRRELMAVRALLTYLLLSVLGPWPLRLLNPDTLNWCVEESFDSLLLWWKPYLRNFSRRTALRFSATVDQLPDLRRRPLRDAHALIFRL